MTNFELVAPRLSLDAKTSDIKKALLAARVTPKPLKVEEDLFNKFAPHLEGHWGSLHERLPKFHAELLSGGWKADAEQKLPSSLLGDFGEFIATEAFRLSQPTGPSELRIARVIRPSGLERPDFLLLNPKAPKTPRLTALEVKSSSVNAEALRKRIASAKGKPTYFTLCSLISTRLQLGAKQLGNSVNVSANANFATFTPGKARFGKARVPAHESAVAVPFFVDGRLFRPYSSAIRAPRGCDGLKCADCLQHQSKPLLFSPVFMNAPSLVEPVEPPQDVTGFFDAYMKLNVALWIGAEEVFRDGWHRLLATLDGDGSPPIQDPALLQTLVDAVERASELDVVEDPSQYLAEVPEKARQSLNAVLTERTATRAEKQRGELPLRNSEAWLAELAVKRLLPPRGKQSLPLTENTNWRDLEQALRADPRTELRLTLHLQNTTAWVMRPPLHGEGIQQLKVAALHKAQLRNVLTTLLEFETADRNALGTAQATKRVRDVGSLPEPMQPRAQVRLGDACVDPEGFGWLQWDYRLD